MSLSFWKIFVVCLVALSVASSAHAQLPEPQEPPVTPQPEEPHVVRTHVKKPKDIKNVKSFKPENKPSPSEVKKIIRIEQKLWGGPSIEPRVACESKYRWNATNGQYRGLLQIGSWWSYAYPQTPRKVVLKDKKRVKRPVRRITRYSDGSKEKEIVRYKKVKKVVVKKGKLPKNADPYHGWASIRVGQRAVSGDGPSTGWACGV